METIMDESGIVRYVVTHPITKAAFTTGLIVLIIYVAGKIMKVLAQAVLAYKGLQGVVNTNAPVYKFV